ncbi:hypothetical protein IQ268_31645 [Oculatella sp. LEGE 06141]|uniref:hypothetical protein n=1 Tax=Oculatella sp. LEGE 06141 TaxID=1828648 RepID=UPI00187F8EAD|nr:hypothetical protein [Oculatella sp. LEGE 06141]MBE9183091.1 hypothetical protein [Oculatella sp. LEGE 06141]
MLRKVSPIALTGGALIVTFVISAYAFAQTPRFFLFKLGRAIDSDSTARVQALIDIDRTSEDFVKGMVELAKAELVAETQTTENGFETLGGMMAINMIDGMAEGLRVQIANQIKDELASVLDRAEQPVTQYLLSQTIQMSGRNTAVVTINKPQGVDWEHSLDSVDIEIKRIDGFWQVVGFGDRTIRETYQARQLEAQANEEAEQARIEAERSKSLMNIGMESNRRRAELAERRAFELEQQNETLQWQMQQAPTGSSVIQSDRTEVGTSSVVGQVGTLVADNAKARINLREQPTDSIPTRRYGLVGDEVTIQDSTTGDDGYTWYNVEFQVSGAVGWIRSDFISVYAD